MNQTTITDLIEDIEKKRKDFLLSKIQKYPQRNPILSNLGECDRQIEYGVLNWQDKEMWNDYVQALFDHGNAEEKLVNRELIDLGYDVMLSQQPVEIKGRSGEILATGKIDGFIKFNGHKFPMEIKSTNPNNFNGIKTLEDLKKTPWMRKYIRQMLMYLYGNNASEGFFLITDCSGHWKFLPIYLDYEECENILKRLEKIHSNIKENKISERIPYNKEVCSKCPFFSTCTPDIVNEGIDIIDSKELEEKLEIRDKLIIYAKEFDVIDKEIKKTAKNNGKDFLIGNFSISIENGETTIYDVPKKIKKEFSKKVPTTTVRIVNNSVKEKKGK